MAQAGDIQRLGRLGRRLAAASALLLGLVPLACAPGSKEVVDAPYLPQTAHEAYGFALSQVSLTDSALGHDWLEHAAAALAEPESIALPFRANGRFEAERAAALGYAFAVPTGRMLEIDLELDAAEPFAAFLDLFRVESGARGDELVHVASAAPAAKTEPSVFRRRLEIRVLEGARYVLRVQPELLRGGDYHIAIEATTALAFPVEGLGLRAIQSGFGAERDGGVRSHRGADIFAPRGTPALASIDAWVRRVETTPIGGNVVWLEDLFSPMRLYYAHLDSQAVAPGQFVTAGTVLGRVGNTGNARTTPTHLHFGVYVRRRGARDPYLFLK